MADHPFKEIYKTLEQCIKAIDAKEYNYAASALSDLGRSTPPELKTLEELRAEMDMFYKRAEMVFVGMARLAYPQFSHYRYRAHQLDRLADPSQARERVLHMKDNVRKIGQLAAKLAKELK